MSTLIYFIRMIKEYFEDLQDINLATKIKNRIDRDEEKIYSSSDVRHNLGLDD